MFDKLQLVDKSDEILIGPQGGSAVKLQEDFMKSRLFCSLLGCTFVALTCVSSASAQQRTFVSGLGNDGNPCSRVAPCRNFAQAISQTNAGGEVIVLDSAGYGAFAISKSVSIIAPPGVYAGISVFSGDGIDINAGASDTIILRGLTVNNQGSLGNGIVFNTGGTLHVESCVANGFLNVSAACGLQFLGAGTLEVKDSIFRDNQCGIEVAPASGTASAAIEHVRLESCSRGLTAVDGSQVTVRNSLSSANLAGFAVTSQGTGPVRLNLESCVVSNNSFGIEVTSDQSAPAEANVERCTLSGNNFGTIVESMSTGIATVRLSNSTVTDNGTGLTNMGAPALIVSRGNNTIEGNTTNTSGTIGSYTAK
jgi:hypothetical protein